MGSEECPVGTKPHPYGVWKGTAPFCAATECDCLQMGEVPYSSQAEVENPCVDIARFNSAGGETTKPCWTGTHVLCLKPVADLINGPAGNLARELNRNIEMQKTMCINGQKFSHEENMGMMKLAGQIVAVFAGKR